MKNQNLLTVGVIIAILLGAIALWIATQPKEASADISRTGEENAMCGPEVADLQRCLEPANTTPVKGCEQELLNLQQCVRAIGGGGSGGGECVCAQGQVCGTSCDKFTDQATCEGEVDCRWKNIGGGGGGKCPDCRTSEGNRECEINRGLCNLETGECSTCKGSGGGGGQCDVTLIVCQGIELPNGECSCNSQGFCPGDPDCPGR